MPPASAAAAVTECPEDDPRLLHALRVPRGPTQLPASVARKFSAYPLMPATLLGHLAVIKRYRGHGIGEFLFLDALHPAFVESSQIATIAVVAVAADDQAAILPAFYFIPLPDGPGPGFPSYEDHRRAFHLNQARKGF